MSPAPLHGAGRTLTLCQSLRTEKPASRRVLFIDFISKSGCGDRMPLMPNKGPMGTGGPSWPPACHPGTGFSIWMTACPSLRPTAQKIQVVILHKILGRVVI